MGRIIRIKLFDQSYTFRTEAEDSRAETIANYLVEEVEKAKASAQLPSKLDTVILAALNIANDYFEIKGGREELVRQIEQRCKLLIDRIDTQG